MTADQLKTYFQTGDMPTQAQFAALVDFIVANSTGGEVSITQVTNLQNTLNEMLEAIGEAGGTFDPYLHVDLTTGQSFTVGDGTFINTMKITTDADTVFRLGTSAGGNDLVVDTPLSSSSYYVFNGFVDEGAAIYATLTGGTTIHLKIKK